MADKEPTQVAQLRAWVAGDHHPEHDTFSMGHGYAKLLLAYIDLLQADTEFAHNVKAIVEAERRARRDTVID